MESNEGFSRNANLQDAAEAQRTLESLASDRRTFADRIRTPSWYYPLLGIATALVIASPGGGIGAISQSMMIVYGSIGMVFLAMAHQKATGVMISRAAGPRSLTVAIIIGVVIFTLLPVSFALAATGNSSWIFLSSGAAFLVMWLGGLFYDKVFIRELRGER